MITVGSRVGGYKVLRMLGQGGMGQVYLAQHQRISRQVAVKVLLPELSSNQGVIERFFTEAQATSLIRHRGIVEVLDCDVVDGQAFIVMEYLEGESLAGYLERLGRHLGDVPFALAVVGQVALAVGAAHDSGIVHRDLKPDNIFLCANPRDTRVIPKVLDFGIAKVALQGAIALTQTGAVIGTPAYMSPEQCRGSSKGVDGRSDVYSLGCILYEALCGAPPFVREGMGEMIIAHISEPPNDPRNLAPGLSPVVADLVLRMLAKNPDDRPATMAALSSEIILCVESMGVRVPLADIDPRRPVVFPAKEGNAIVGTPAPLSGRTPAPRSQDARTPGGSLMAEAGGTRVLAPVAPTVEARPAAAPPTTFRGAAGERTPWPGRTGDASSRWKWGIPLAAIVVIGGAIPIFLKLARQREAANDSGPAARPEAEGPRGIAVGGAPPVAAPPVAPPVAAPPVAAPPVAASPAAASPATVTVDVRGVPEGAQILFDGTLTAGLPLSVRRDDRHHLLIVRVKGYQDRTIEIEAARDEVVDVSMSARSKSEKSRGHVTGVRPGPGSAGPAGSAPGQPSSSLIPRRDAPPAQTEPIHNDGQKKPNYDDM